MAASRENRSGFFGVDMRSFPDGVSDFGGGIGSFGIALPYVVHSRHFLDCFTIDLFPHPNFSGARCGTTVPDCATCKTAKCTKVLSCWRVKGKALNLILFSSCDKGINNVVE